MSDKKQTVYQNEVIVNRINYYLTKDNITINKLAKLSSVPQTTLSGIFNYGRIPSIPTLIKLCEVFGVSLIEFLDIYPYNKITTPSEVVNQK